MLYLINNLDNRICDVEVGCDGVTKTYRQFIEETEEEFNLCRLNLDIMSNKEINDYLKYLNDNWLKNR